MLEQWQEQRTLPVSLVRAMLLAEGVSSPEVLAAHEAVVEDVLAGIDQHVRDRHAAGKKAKTIFKRLHRDVLKRYDEDAQLADLADGGRFNCVTGTALFYLAAQRHGVPVALHATPVHVYAVADPAGEALRIEITDPKKGFDFDDEREDVIDHLLAYKMITPEELALEGEDAVYRTFMGDEWTIQPEDLVGIVYNNEAALSIAAEQYEAAVGAYEKALRIEPDREEYRRAYAGALAILAYDRSEDPEEVIPTLHRALAARGGDTLFAEAALPVVRGMAIQLVVKQRFEAAVETVRLARTHMPQELEDVDGLARLEAGVHHDWSTSMMRRGDYEAVWEKGGRAYALVPDEPLFHENYVFASCRYAAHLGDQGDAEAGIEIVEALTEHVEAYPIIGEAYARLVLHRVASGPDALNKSDPEAAKALVRHALEVVPDRSELRSAMAWIYHEEAMAEIRADDYEAAAALVEEGLRYAPDDQMLREDLDLIRETY